eukprot:scaffold4856_cov309-Prasinococcus_capsulatus_cf.AAC.3
MGKLASRNCALPCGADSRSCACSSSCACACDADMPRPARPHEPHPPSVRTPRACPRPCW